MEKLDRDWLTEGLIDFEYKKYILLAYLKDVRKRFDQTELYPFFSDLIFHYRNLKKVADNKELIYSDFPKEISKADFKKLALTYKMVLKDDEVMEQIEEIILFAIPRIDEQIRIGRELYELVEENLEITPVGISPLYVAEGYFFVNIDQSRDVSIYRYGLTLFEKSEERYRGLSTTFIGNEMIGINRTFEHLKLSLTKSFRDLPNPSTFLVRSKIQLPEVSTVLPVAKRAIMRMLPT